jgi:hypothetical protein
MGDVATLIAPPLLLVADVETGRKDYLNGASGLKNVGSQMRIIRKADRLLGAPQSIKQDVFEGEHRWNGVEAIPWIKTYLGIR